MSYIKTLKELKLQTADLTDFTKINPLDINDGLVQYLSQEQKNQRFIDKSKLIHGNKYNYSKSVYINNLTKVEIICLECGKCLFQTPSGHMAGHGCRDCETKNSLYNKIKNCQIFHDNNKNNRIKKSLKRFLEKSKNIHGGAIILKNTKMFKNTRSKIDFYCTICGSTFIQLCRSHTAGVGCPICSLNNRKIHQNDIIERSKHTHGDNEYSYSLINYTNSDTKITIIHNKCGKLFHITPHNHIHNRGGCPHCKKSKGEKSISVILENNNIKFDTQHHFNKHKSLKRTSHSSYLSFDFYLLDYNLCIEYDGEQHFKPVKHYGGKNSLKFNQQRDQIKNQFCLDNNIRLVRIPYWVKPTEELILQQFEEKFTIKTILK